MTVVLFLCREVLTVVIFLCRTCDAVLFPCVMDGSSCHDHRHAGCIYKIALNLCYIMVYMIMSEHTHNHPSPLAFIFGFLD